MTIPSSYTEKSLAEYMHSAGVLGHVATVLGLAVGVSDAGSYAEAVNETLLVYGEDDITDITGSDNLRKLRGLARVQAWKMVVGNFAALYKFSADGGTYDRNQLFEQARKALEIAEADAIQWLPEYAVLTGKLDPIHDPYRYLPDDERPT